MLKEHFNNTANTKEHVDGQNEDQNGLRYRFWKTLTYYQVIFKCYEGCTGGFSGTVHGQKK